MVDKIAKTCKRCGRNDLEWVQSKKGNWYLTYVGGVDIVGSCGRAIKTIRPTHECLVRDGALTERRAELILLRIITTTPEEHAEAEEIKCYDVAFDKEFLVSNNSDRAHAAGRKAQQEHDERNARV